MSRVPDRGARDHAGHRRARDAAQDTPALPPAVSAPLNLNAATVAQLEALPGIGRATAERIVEYRQKNGGFKKAEDLMNVRGIGEKNFLKLKPLVTVASASRRRRRSGAADGPRALGPAARRGTWLHADRSDARVRHRGRRRGHRRAGFARGRRSRARLGRRALRRRAVPSGAGAGRRPRRGGGGADRGAAIEMPRCRRLPTPTATGSSRADIDDGVDARLDGPVPLAALFPGVAVTDEGAVRLFSFSPDGTATTGSVYLREPRRHPLRGARARRDRAGPDRTLRRGAQRLGGGVLMHGERRAAARRIPAPDEPLCCARLRAGTRTHDRGHLRHRCARRRRGAATARHAR